MKSGLAGINTPGILSQAAEQLAKNTLWDRRPEFIKTLFDGQAGDAEFNEALERVIEAAIAKMEANVKDFDPDHAMYENGLSYVFASNIEMPGITVSRETN